MSKEFVEISIPAGVDSGELLAMISGSDALGAWEGEGILYLYWPREGWTGLVLEELEHALMRLGADDAAAQIVVRSLPDQDWNSRWTESLEPIRVGRRFRIRQSWNLPDPAFDGIELIIDPKRAFGTGYHATTQLIVEWLETHIHGGEHVLDIGTGSGILAMAALKLGAASALGIDHDPIAIECASENAVMNGFGSEVRLRTATVEDVGEETFNVIVANLDRNTIIGICQLLRIHLRKRGELCLSGLQKENMPEIADALAAAGGRIVDRRERDEWLAVSVQF